MEAPNGPSPIEYWDAVGHRQFMARAKGHAEVKESLLASWTDDRVIERKRVVTKRLTRDASADTRESDQGVEGRDGSDQDVKVFGHGRRIVSDIDAVSAFVEGYDFGTTCNLQVDEFDIGSRGRDTKQDCGQLTGGHCGEHEKGHCRNTKASSGMIDIKFYDDGTMAATAKMTFGPESVGSRVAEILPLAVLPQIPANGELAVCLNCCQTILWNETPGKCEGCRWPVCKNGCDTVVSLHDEEECKILTRVWDMKHWKMPAGYECLWLIRVMNLRLTNPDAYQRVMSIPEDVVLEKKDLVPGVYFAKETLRRMYGLNEEEFCDKELEHVWYVLRTKCLKGYFLGSDKFRRVKLLYDDVAMFDHSCVPNATYHIDSSFRMIITLLQPIETGEQITINYDPSSTFQPTYFRQARLLSLFKFKCCCERCDDPTEFGTNFGGVPCHSDKRCGSSKTPGFLLPIDKSDPTSPWKCSFCNSEEVPWEKIRSWILSIRGGLEDLAVCQDPEFLCFFLEELVKQNVLHQTHHLVFEYFCEALKLFAMQLEIDKTRRSSEEILKYNSAARTVCKIYRAFLPSNASGSSFDLSALIKVARLVERFRKGEDTLRLAKQDLERYVVKRSTGQLELRRPFSDPNWCLKDISDSVISSLITHIEMNLLEVRGLGNSGSKELISSLDEDVKFLRSTLYHIDADT